MLRHLRLVGLSLAALTATAACTHSPDDDDDASIEGEEAELNGQKRYWVSDLHFALQDSGYGPLARDKSNGELADGDGKKIGIRGKRFVKGLGVHAPSDVRVNLGGTCSRFIATVGIDDEVAPNGAVSFEVWADGTRLLQTGTLNGTSAPQVIDVGIAGRQQLQLVVRSDGALDYDHADWASARIYCATPPPAISAEGGAPPPAPPPPAVDLWSPESCTGPRITLQQAKARFTPGALTADLGTLQMAARRHRCNTTTGCGPWESFNQLPYTFVWSDPRWGAMNRRQFLPLVTPSDRSAVWFQAATQTWQDPVRLRVSYVTTAGQGLDLNLKFDGSSSVTDGSPYASAVGACRDIGCPGTDRVYGGELSSGASEFIVTPSCMRFVTRTKDKTNQTTVYDEFETVFYSRF